MLFLEASEYQPLAQRVFESVRAEVNGLLPHARVEHVGASSVPGAISKGDVDVYVGVETHQHEAAICTLEANGYVIKPDTLRTASLCMLVTDKHDCDVALQVVESGSKFEMFLIFRDRLSTDEKLLGEYNRMKLESSGMDAEDYRLRKSKFIESVLNR